MLYSCQAPSSSGTDTYTLTLANPADVLFFRVLPANGLAGDVLPVTVTAPDGSTVSCQQPIQLSACAASQPGSYTVAVSNEGSTYTLEYTALLSESNCPAVNPSFSAPVTKGATAAGQTGNCYSLTVPSGHVLHAESATRPNAITLGVYDSTGAQVCVDDQGDCTLSGPGPYRVFVSAFYGEAEHYQAQLNDITSPAGCAAAAQQTFGQVPPVSVRSCRAITVATADQYQIYGTNSRFSSVPGTLYFPDGSAACTGNGPYCQLASGTYNFVADQLLGGDGLATVFIAADESRGCGPANDTGFAAGDATGSFTGAGEEICLTLPTAAGLSDYLINQPVSSASQGEVLAVVDATGAQSCAYPTPPSDYATCALTGAAPFRVIIVPPGAQSSYRLLVQRTDSAAGCATWPQSGFGAAAGLNLKLTTMGNARCLTIPAADHSTGEMIAVADATNSASAGLFVNNPAGAGICGGNGEPTSWSFCSYQPGVSYTGILLGTGHGDAYRLVRRDVTSSAKCSAPASTTAGGASSAFTLTSSVAAQCFRVAAASKDKLWFSLRTVAPDDPAVFSTPHAVLEVTKGSGAIVCGFRDYCTVTGSTDYQVIVLTNDYTGMAITVHLDTWLVRTAAGWAPRCQAHHFSAAAGWGPVSATLTERSAGYCAVVDIKPNQDFGIYGTDSAFPPDNAWANIFTAQSWGSYSNFGLCAGGEGVFTVTCDTSDAPAGQALLLVWPFDSQNPTGFTMQGVCQFPCSPAPPPLTLTSVSPASQPAGPDNSIVLTGTGLSFATPFRLVDPDSAGSTYQVATPVSVNSAGTSLTLRLDTTQVPAGTYDVQAGDDSCSPTFPCTGWLQNAYTVTPGPKAPAPTRFVPVRPTRILDTQTGVAAPKAPVPAHGTVTFPVAGAGGVPATQVKAVLLDVSAVAPSRAGHLTAFAAGRPRPPANTVDFAAGQTMTGLVTVQVANGKASIYNASAGAADLTADVVGYDTSAGTGAKLKTVGPARILDTRTGIGAPKARVGPGQAVALQVSGVGGVPATGATAVTLDVSAIGPAKAGHLVAYPDGTSRPGVTSLSFAAGQRVTDLVAAQVTDGKVDLYNDSAGPVDLAADVVGYYSNAGSVLRPVGAVPVMDTRTGLGGAGQTIQPQAATTLSSAAILGRIPALPAGVNVTAVLLNVTILGPGQAGLLAAFPDGSTALPSTWNIAFGAGRPESSLVVVPLGDIDFYNHSAGSIQVAADVEGYYTS